METSISPDISPYLTPRYVFQFSCKHGQIAFDLRSSEQGIIYSLNYPSSGSLVARSGRGTGIFFPKSYSMIFGSQAPGAPLTTACQDIIRRICRIGRVLTNRVPS